VALGAVALVVGGVGIANVMVISFLERRGEIGLRRALGATRAHVGVQFNGPGERLVAVVLVVACLFHRPHTIRTINDRCGEEEPWPRTRSLLTRSGVGSPGPILDFRPWSQHSVTGGGRREPARPYDLRPYIPRSRTGIVAQWPGSR